MKLFKSGRSPRKRGKVTKGKGITKGRQAKLGEKKTQKTKLPKRKLPYTIKSSKRQVGISDKAKDKKRTALAPGRRKSKSGREYTENRKNRSDLSGGV